MAWTVDKTMKNMESGFFVEKQTEPRKNRSDTPSHGGTKKRYRVVGPDGLYFMLNRELLYNLADLLDDVCDDIEEGKF